MTTGIRFSDDTHGWATRGGSSPLFKVEEADAERVLRFLEERQIPHLPLFEMYAADGKTGFRLDLAEGCSFCDQCGLRPVVVVAPDPYDDEVYPEDGPYKDERWCAYCFKERSDEI